MCRIFQIILLIVIFTSCETGVINDPNTGIGNKELITAVDISRYPEISGSNPTFYDLKGNQNDFLTILKENGINTVRLRLWVHPDNEHSGFEEVKQFSETLKNMGFKIWITLHYSDTWAHPGQQQTPSQWSGIGLNNLKDSLYVYTKKVITDIKPHFVQIGNEINTGILHPYGDISTRYQNFISLLQEGISAVRESSDDCKIILHYAGTENADWFFRQLSTIDYDIIGLSYYPVWHGKSLNNLRTTIQHLSESNNKQIIIAETAYPFTLEWNDWTHNIVGSDEQLILPEYPATSEGQRKFIKDLKISMQEVDKGIGFCYWGAELIAWKGNQSTAASPWENQALFDFDNEALPVLREFQNE